MRLHKTSSAAPPEHDAPHRRASARQQALGSDDIAARVGAFLPTPQDLRSWEAALDRRVPGLYAGAFAGQLCRAVGPEVRALQVRAQVRPPRHFLPDAYYRRVLRRGLPTSVLAALSDARLLAMWRVLWQGPPAQSPLREQVQAALLARRASLLLPLYGWACQHVPPLVRQLAEPMGTSAEAQQNQQATLAPLAAFFALVDAQQIYLYQSEALARAIWQLRALGLRAGRAQHTGLEDWRACFRDALRTLYQELFGLTRGPTADGGLIDSPPPSPVSEDELPPSPSVPG